MAELADAQDLGSCGDSVWVQVPLPAPRRSKLRCTASTGTAERLCLLTFVPLRLFFLSKPDPLCWAPVLFFMGFGLFRRLFLRSKKRPSSTSLHPFLLSKLNPLRWASILCLDCEVRSVCSSFQNRTRFAGLRFCFIWGLVLSKRDLKPEAWASGFAFGLIWPARFCSGRFPGIRGDCRR